MTGSPRKVALESILLENNQHFLRVSEIRDLLVGRLENYDGDKAKLRRWIYSVFKTMLIQGRLEKRLDPNSDKTQYRYIGDVKPADEVAELETSIRSDLSQSLNRVKTLLHESKRRSHIIIGQLNAYRLIREDSELISYADKKYAELSNESLELAGQIKVLEDTLIDHDRGLV